MMSGKILIPDALLAAKSVEAFEDWMLFWRPTTGASMRDEMRAANNLATERFVRRNVSRQKFQEWLQENPRTFTTAREQDWLSRKHRLPSVCEVTPCAEASFVSHYRCTSGKAPTNTA